MALTLGMRLAAYEILAPLGAGGMGEVYRARDEKLGRNVALKVLPESLASDPERVARLQREAKTLAALNHTNIAIVHGFEEADGIRALVMELVEGPTLADQIAAGRVSLDEALPIARQIADALEAAHEQGIIHRDLKPANIKVRDDGTVKVLDFGLAKALGATGATGETRAPLETLTSPAITAAGIILGTAAYMSPEQARGRPADKRSDLWAFGCVLYEMLTGARAFGGDDISDTLAAVLRADPDWRQLPVETPPSIQRLLRRCLEKDRKRRLSDASDARLEIDDAASKADLEPLARKSDAARRTTALMVACALLFGAAAATAVLWYQRPAVSAPQVTRFAIPLPDEQAFVGAIPRHVLAVSPDGTQIVYAAGSAAQGDVARTPGRLFLRSMAGLNVQPIQGIEEGEGATNPVFSPDGRTLLYYSTDTRTLRTISLAGGRPQTLCRADSPYGISWTADGIVVGQGRNGIMRVSLDGADPTVLVRVGVGEEAHGPQLLPGGQHVLFTVARGGGPDRWQDARIVVQSLSSGDAKTVIDGGTDARYIPTGHLVYARQGALFAIRFDPRRVEVVGDRMMLVDNVRWSGGRTTGASHFSVSSSGTLVYIAGSGFQDRFDIVLTDRKGAIERLNIPADRYSSPPRVSPDGRRIVFGTDDGKEAILYTYELSGAEPMRRITFGANHRFPVWSPDGQRIVFQSDRGGDLGLWQSAPGGSPERLTIAAAGEAHTPESWSAKEPVLLYTVSTPTHLSLWTLSLPAKSVAPFGDVRSTYEINARFHPNGRWVAYTVWDRDITSIIVEPYPPTGARYQLGVRGPTASPHKAVWSPDGTELFYIPGIGQFEAVAIRMQPTFSFGNAVSVPRPFAPGSPADRTRFDITPDGRFVALATPGRAEPSPRPPSGIHVVLNAFEELQGRGSRQ